MKDPILFASKVFPVHGSHLLLLCCKYMYKLWRFLKINISNTIVMWDSNEKSVKPSETVLRDVFETFGPLSAIDIPLLDPFREKIHAIQKKMMEPIKEGLFDAYIQYQEYGSFAKCMSAFRGMKLLYDNGQFAWTVPIEVIYSQTSPRSLLLLTNEFDRLILIELST